MLHRRNKSSGTANEEWSEILAAITETEVSVTSRLAPVDPTPEEEVDVNKALSVQDLRSLKKQDPFLYYSIPGVRNAAVRFDAVDLDRVAQDGLRRSCISCPASIQTAAFSEEAAVVKVKRCKRLSFECHADLLLEDLIEDDDIDMDLEKRLNNLSLGNDSILADLFQE